MQKSNFSFIVVEDDIHALEGIVNRMKPFENWHCVGKETKLSEAYLKIDNFKPQLLFLDWEVIGGNTFTLLEKIKSILNYKPYIIYFTGYQSDNPQIPVDIVNKYEVNKYLVKPIFEDLTKNLANYINEAESLIKKQKKDFWINTIEKSRLKIEVDQIICISQSKSNSRNKIIYLMNNKQIEFKASWELCEKIAIEYGIEYIFTNIRETMINKKFVTKKQKPYIWLNNTIKVEVTKERWKYFE